MKRMIKEKEELIACLDSADAVTLEDVDILQSALNEGYRVEMRKGYWYDDEDADFEVEFVKYKWREETEMEAFERRQSHLRWKQRRLELLQKETAELKEELKEANK